MPGHAVEVPPFSSMTELPQGERGPGEPSWKDVIPSSMAGLLRTDLTGLPGLLSCVSSSKSGLCPPVHNCLPQSLLAQESCAHSSISSLTWLSKDCQDREVLPSSLTAGLPRTGQVLAGQDRKATHPPPWMTTLGLAMAWGARTWKLYSSSLTGLPRPSSLGKVHLPSFSAGLTRSCHVLSSQVVDIVILLPWMASSGPDMPWEVRLGLLNSPFPWLGSSEMGMPWRARPGTLHPCHL